MMNKNHDVREMLDFLLTRIGSWTHARWDQHLRCEFGDEATDRVITWLGYNKEPAGTAPSLRTDIIAIELCRDDEIYGSGSYDAR